MKHQNNQSIIFYAIYLQIKVMKKHLSLLLLFFILLFCDVFNVSAGEKYKVTANTTLNVRAAPNSSSTVIGSLPRGTYIEVNGFKDNWGIISFHGQTGYVNKDYLEKSITNTPVQNNSTTIKSTKDFWEYFLIITVCIFILYLLCNFFTVGESFSLLFLIIIPILNLIYFIWAPNPMWFLSPSTVGWIWTIVNGVGFIMLVSFMWGTTWGLFKDTISDFSIISLLFLILYVVALWNVVMTAIMELMIIGILMIIGSASGSSYVGEFTDRNGNKYDVYR